MEIIDKAPIRLSRHGELRKGSRLGDRGSGYSFELKPKGIIDAIQVDQCSWQVDEKRQILIGSAPARGGPRLVQFWCRGTFDKEV